MVREAEGIRYFQVITPADWNTAFTYKAEVGVDAEVGNLVQVSFGHQRVKGIVVDEVRRLPSELN